MGRMRKGVVHTPARYTGVLRIGRAVYVRGRWGLCLYPYVNDRARVWISMDWEPYGCRRGDEPLAFGGQGTLLVWDGPGMLIEVRASDLAMVRGQQIRPIRECGEGYLRFFAGKGCPIAERSGYVYCHRAVAGAMTRQWPPPPCIMSEDRTDFLAVRTEDVPHDAET